MDCDFKPVLRGSEIFVVAVGTSLWKIVGVTHKLKFSHPDGQWSGVGTLLAKFERLATNIVSLSITEYFSARGTDYRNGKK